MSQGIPPNVLAVRALTPPPPIQDGLSWATAFGNPQDAIALIASDPFSPFDEIWVAEGICKPTSTGDRTISFELVPGVQMYGGFLGGETSRDDRPTPFADTILSGDLDNFPASVTSDSLHVVRIREAGQHWLEGFIIERGAAIPSAGDPIPGNPDNWGGGLLAYDPIGEADTEVELRDVTFRNCIAGGGGGLAAGTGVDFVRLSRCRFDNNVGFARDPDVEVGYFGVGGGALFWNIGGTRVLRTQGGEGTGLQNVVEGVYTYHTTFSGNRATYGGAVCVANVEENIWLINSLFHRNSAYGGGALFDYQGSVTVSDPVGWPRVEFCTFASNAALDSLGPATGLWSGGGAIHTQWGVGGQPPFPSIVVQSSILWGNTDQSPATVAAASIGGGAAVAAQVLSSDVEVPASSTPPWPGWNANGNINQDPLFVNAVGGNLRLSFGSPCIDAAEDQVLDRTPGLGLGDFADVDRNGIFGGTNGQHLPIDLDLTPARESFYLTVPLPTLALPNVRADMGCYEYFLGNPGAQ